MNDAPLLDGPVADALRRGRDRYNTKFALARRSFPALEGENLGEHLRAYVAPVVAAVAPDAQDETFDALYDISLELLGKEFFGPRARYPAVLAGWTKLLPAAPQLLAQEPRRVAGAITNALYNLAAEPNAKTATWLEEMQDIAPHCAGVNEFLTAGQVLAWRAGLAQYRESALSAARALPEELARRVLALSPAAPPLSEAITRLEQDPWLDPARIKAGPPERHWLQVMASAGGFRGFGGPFLTPPTVVCQDGKLIVSDQESSWLVTADLFGATLHRLGAALPSNAPSQSNPSFTINGLGKIEHGPISQTVNWLAGSSSSAANETTLAATLPLSHLLFLVARVSE
jgi:hypothetical protein